jgi:hypothetical protein
MNSFGVFSTVAGKGRRWRSRRRDGQHDRREARPTTWNPGGRVRSKYDGAFRSRAEVKHLTGRLLRAKQEND